MKTMTSFIDATSITSSPAAYNEEYAWAEEYAEYYDESSEEYLGDAFDSSAYQFFGEAVLPRKGLLAGGILALVSGAFFMIMKLLKNGNNGKSSSSNKTETEADKLEKKLKENGQKLKKEK